MPRERKQRPNKLAKFLANLHDMLAALPSQSEKEEAESGFLKLIEFLTDLKTRFELVPSSEDVANLRVIVERLEASLSRAESDPILGAVFGIGSPRPRTARSRSSAIEKDSPAAKAILAELESLSIDDIRTRLETDAYSLTVLRSLAASLGVRPTKGLARDALAHQISMRIANARGYQHLRGTGTTSREKSAKDTPVSGS